MYFQLTCSAVNVILNVAFKFCTGIPAKLNESTGVFAIRDTPSFFSLKFMLDCEMKRDEFLKTTMTSLTFSLWLPWLPCWIIPEATDEISGGRATYMIN